MKKCWCMKMVFLVAMSVCASTLLAGEIRGTVKIRGAFSEGGQNGDTYKVLLADEYGRPIDSVYTKSDGTYRFTSLDSGDYQVSLAKDNPFQVAYPECGIYYEYLGEGGTLNLPFVLFTSGVAVDFGRPTGNGPLAPTTSFQKSEEFHFSVYGEDLDNFQPDTIEVTGFFFIPGQNPLDVISLDGWSNGVYGGSSMLVDNTNINPYRVKMTMEYSYMVSNGEVATFSFKMTDHEQLRIDNALGNMAFCAESIILYRNGVLVDSSSSFWLGNYFDLIP